MSGRSPLPTRGARKLFLFYAHGYSITACQKISFVSMASSLLIFMMNLGGDYAARLSKKMNKRNKKKRILSLLDFRVQRNDFSLLRAKEIGLQSLLSC